MNETHIKTVAKDKEAKCPIERIELIRISLDLLVLIVMALTLYVAVNANKVALEGLHGSHVPWFRLSVGEIKAISKNECRMEIIMNNSSANPALKLRTWVGVGPFLRPIVAKNYSCALMPAGSIQTYSSLFGPDSEAIVKRLKEGVDSVKFISRYQNVFGKTYQLEQELRWIEGGFRDVFYDVKGLIDSELPPEPTEK